MPHTNPICKLVSTAKKIPETDLIDFDPEVFFREILRKQTKKPALTSGNEGNSSPTSPGVSPTEGGHEDSDDDSEIEDEYNDEFGDDSEEDLEKMDLKTVPASSISDIVILGFHMIRGDTIINATRHITVTDMLIAPPSFDLLKNDPAMLHDTTKIVQMKALYPGKKDITCRMYRARDNGSYDYVYFRLIPEHKEQLSVLIKKLFTKTKGDKPGTTKAIPKHASIFIASNWRLSESPYQLKDIDYPCYTAIIHNTRKQIFGLPLAKKSNAQK